MMNRWYLDSSTLMRVQSGAFCWQGDIEAVNYYMNKVASEIFSFFDVGGKTGESEPERFYHGFVLGLMAEQSESYEIRSNRERGFGRYDAELIARGISKERIKHYGFAFEGKMYVLHKHRISGAVQKYSGQNRRKK